MKDTSWQVVLDALLSAEKALRDHQKACELPRAAWISTERTIRACVPQLANMRERILIVRAYLT